MKYSLELLDKHGFRANRSISFDKLDYYITDINDNGQVTGYIISIRGKEFYVLKESFYVYLEQTRIEERSNNGR